jgi:hypothetical protein
MHYIFKKLLYLVLKMPHIILWRLNLFMLSLSVEELVIWESASELVGSEELIGCCEHHED